MTVKCLIVDDEARDVELTKAALVNSHFEFEVADCLSEGKMRLESYQPSMILLDIGIPPYRTDGMGKVKFNDILDFVKEAKDRSTVVMLTGHVQPDHITRAIQCGACGFIDKALLLNRDEFEARIREAMKLHRIRSGTPNEQGEIMAGMIALRALVEYSITKINLISINTGKIQDEKTRQTWKEAYAAGKKKGLEESRAKIAAKWGAFIYTAGSIGYVAWSFIRGLVAAKEHH